jgi:hypothetical protein
MLATRLMPVWVVGVTSSNNQTESDDYQWNVRVAGVFLCESAAEEFREQIANLDTFSHRGLEIEGNIHRLVAAGRINAFFGWNWCDVPTADKVREGDLRDLTTWEGVCATAVEAMNEKPDSEENLYEWFQEWTYEQSSFDYMYPMASGLYPWIEKTYMGSGNKLTGEQS